MLIYLVLLHIQYYAPIPVCLSTWYYYTYNIIHEYLYVSLPGITTHTILCTNTCMLVYLVLLQYIQVLVHNIVCVVIPDRLTYMYWFIVLYV
jgi:hypothetical protein